MGGKSLSVVSFIVLLTLWSGMTHMVSASEDVVQKHTQLVSDKQLILLRAMSFDPVVAIPSESSFQLTPLRENRVTGLLHIVQFSKTPSAGHRSRLSEAGIELLYYIPNNAYLVRCTSEAANTMRDLPDVRASFRLPKWAKIDPDIRQRMTDPVPLELIMNPADRGGSVFGLLKKLFPMVTYLTNSSHHDRGRILCDVPAHLLSDFLDRAAGLEDVLSIMVHHPKMLLNDNSVWVGQSYDTTNTTNYSITATIWNRNITGTNQIVCVNDSGLDGDMCYFRYDGTVGSKTDYQALTPPSIGTLLMSNKVIAYYLQPGADAYDTASASYHGTHVAGSVLGDNYANLSTPTSGGHDNGDGMAPNAKLVFQDVGDATGGLSGLAGDLSDMFLQAYDAGARIHSDSWGTTASVYDATALDMDEFMFRHEDFLFVVAMGNSGTSPGDGSIGSPATAKGIVSVGATTNGGATSQADNLRTYSRGPVDDGRLKPDIVSPGAVINSASGDASFTSNNCSAKTMSGTSMATPTTSGYLALLRQYFTDGFYPTGAASGSDARIPTGALMKAVLVNGGMPLGGTDDLTSSPVSTIPSMDQGWGRTHLDNSLYFPGDTRRLRVWDIRNADGITTGEQIEYSINVTSSTRPLKVHLVWTDPESTTLASVNLVNNLDLEVVAPGGTTYRGNVFSGGVSTTGGSADVLNPVEGVVVNNPTTGIWTLRVKGTAIPGTGTAPYSDRQGYALAATFNACSSTLTAPTGFVANDNATDGIDLSWNAVSGATGYLIYRATGSSPAPEDYSLVGTTGGTAFTDTAVQGGYTYSYVVRATDDCSESPASAADAATYTGNCDLYPDFGGLQSVTNDLGSALCDLVLDWNAATSNCPLGLSITYNIYRGTTPYFTPGPASLLISGVSATGYTDYFVAPLVTYYYIVRAEDSTTLNSGPNNGGNEDGNVILLAGTAWSSTTAAGTFFDDGGDTNAKLALEGEWRVTNQQNHTSSGNFSYHNAMDGMTHSAGQCAAATTPPLELQAASSPVLSYWINYNLEVDFDGVVVEISTNGGSSWTTLTPNEGYPNDFSQTGSPAINACGYAASQQCFNGPTGNTALTGWNQYTHNLSSYAGQTVLIRWNFSSDPGFELEGLYLDDIQVTNASVNIDCATSNGSVSLDRVLYNCSDSISINVGDSDLTGDTTVTVSITSTTEPGGETVTLNENPSNSGNFEGTIQTTANAPGSDGLLSTTDGDTITVTYIDADDGLGGFNVPKTDTATADCVLPVISNVQVINIDFDRATITWSTNENADSMVIYQNLTPPSSLSQYDSALVTSHSLLIQGLTECTKFYFYVESADGAGNTADDDNGGVYYSFTTTKNVNPTYTNSTPVAIPDNNPTGASSVIAVTDDKVVQDVNVMVNITHTYDGDLELSLIGPNSTEIMLCNNRGGSGDNFVNTVFDDEAAGSITTGTAPFTGSFIPETALSTFDSLNAQGNWTLKAVDTAGTDTGTINDWSLTLLYPSEACPSPDGWIQFGDTVYGCSSTMTIDMQDSDLAGSGNYSIELYSDTETISELVSLTEAPLGSGVFTGSFPTTSAPASNGDGHLSIQNGDTITAYYLDADDGLGGIDVPKTDTALANCAGPTISNVQISNISGSSADITWTTSTDADSEVVYDETTPPAAWTETNSSMVTSHTISLTGLDECTTYYFYVQSTDVFSNIATDSNGGAYYSFTTLRSSAATIASTDTPRTIPDPGSTTSTIVVADNKTVVDVNVAVNITHTWTGDVTITLITPTGTNIVLSDRIGSSGDNYTDTIFDDEAITLITSGTPPYTGSFIPLNPLSAADGINAAGNWQLRVTDVVSPDSGTLTSWTLTLTYESEVCGPSAQYQSHSLVQDTCALGGPGDNDTIWDAGEQIQLSVTINSNGTDPLTGLSATLQSLTPGVTVIDGTASFNDLAPGASGTSLSPHFTVQLSPGLTCDDTLDFQINVTSNEGNWSDTFSQNIGSITQGNFNLLDENFEAAWGPYGDNPPAGWTIEDHGSVPGVWNANDWHQFSKGGLYGSVARVYYSPTETQNEYLITPAFTIPADAVTVDLEFDHYYNDYDAADFAYIDYSSDQTTWTTLMTYTADTADMAHGNISLLAYAGETNARIRFRYVGYYGWYWQVDNVKVTGTQPSSCTMNVCNVGTPPGEVSGSGATFMLEIVSDATNCPGTGFCLTFQQDGDATGYNVYEGTIGSWYSHDGAAGNVCDATVDDLGTGQMRHALNPSSGNKYYLITGFNTSGEGTAGSVERDAGRSCAP